jgi:spermidine synthase
MAGEAHSLKVEKVLFQGKSDYQNVMVFQVKIFYCTNAAFSSSSLKLEYEPVLLFCFLVLHVRQGACAGWSDSGH